MNRLYQEYLIHNSQNKADNPHLTFLTTIAEEDFVYCIPKFEISVYSDGGTHLFVEDYKTSWKNVCYLDFAINSPTKGKLITDLKTKTLVSNPKEMAQYILDNWTLPKHIPQYLQKIIDESVFS